MLDFLEGISPIWWLIAAFALGAIEMLSTTTYLLWPALAALAMAGVLFAAPGLSGEFQASLFAVLCIALTVAGRYLVNRVRGGSGVSDSLNDPAKRAVGTVAELVEIGHGEGTILIDGVRWHARLDPSHRFAVGDRVRVTDAEGTTLTVKPVS